MSDIITIQTNPNTGKDIRVVWDSIGDVIEQHEHNWAEYAAEGFGEDGSHWGGSVQGDEHNIESDVDMAEILDEDDRRPIKWQMLRKPVYMRYTGLWDMNGDIIKIKRNEKSTYARSLQDGPLPFPKVPIKEWFDRTLGEFPNIDKNKGPISIINNKFLYDNPRIKHQFLNRSIWHLMDSIMNGTNKDYVITNDKIAATNSAILKFKLVSNLKDARDTKKWKLASSIYNRLLDENDFIDFYNRYNIKSLQWSSKPLSN